MRFNKQRLDLKIVDEIQSELNVSRQVILDVINKYCRNLAKKAKNPEVFEFYIKNICKFELDYEKAYVRKRVYKKKVIFKVTDKNIDKFTKSIILNILEKYIKQLNYDKHSKKENRSSLKKRYGINSKIFKHIREYEYRKAQETAGSKFEAIRERCDSILEGIYSWISSKYGVVGISITDLQILRKCNNYRSGANKVFTMYMRNGIKNKST